MPPQETESPGRRKGPLIREFRSKSSRSGFGGGPWPAHPATSDCPGFPSGAARVRHPSFAFDGIKIANCCDCTIPLFGNSAMQHTQQIGDWFYALFTNSGCSNLLCTRSIDAPGILPHFSPVLARRQDVARHLPARHGISWHRREPARSRVESPKSAGLPGIRRRMPPGRSMPACGGIPAGAVFSHKFPTFRLSSIKSHCIP